MFHLFFKYKISMRVEYVYRKFKTFKKKLSQIINLLMTFFCFYLNVSAHTNKADHRKYFLLINFINPLLISQNF